MEIGFVREIRWVIGCSSVLSPCLRSLRAHCEFGAAAAAAPAERSHPPPPPPLPPKKPVMMQTTRGEWKLIPSFAGSRTATACQLGAFKSSFSSSPPQRLVCICCSGRAGSLARSCQSACLKSDCSSRGSPSRSKEGVGGRAGSGCPSVRRTGVDKHIKGAGCLCTGLV